jgi:ribosomal protein S18 acetylase RimI-like enzyme
MMKIEENLKNNHAESIRLDAFSNNQISLRMYRKLGYKKSRRSNLAEGIVLSIGKDTTKNGTVR